MSTRQVDLVVTVAGIVPYGLGYGLQGKSGELVGGQIRDDGVEFRCTVTVRTGADGSGPPGGSFVHGKSGNRFLYLSFRGSDGEWVRRTKIALPDRLDPSADQFSTRVRDVGTPWTAVEQAWAGRPGT